MPGRRETFQRLDRDSTWTHSTGVHDGSNQDVLTARGRRARHRNAGRVSEITVTINTPDGIGIRPGVGEPRATAWRGWTGAGEERRSEHARGPWASGAEKLYGWRGPNALAETVVQERGWGASHWPHQVD